jgi:hypothetical protein
MSLDSSDISVKNEDLISNFEKDTNQDKNVENTNDNQMNLLNEQIEFLTNRFEVIKQMLNENNENDNSDNSDLKIENKSTEEIYIRNPILLSHLINQKYFYFKYFKKVFNIKIN